MYALPALNKVEKNVFEKITSNKVIVPNGELYFGELGKGKPLS